MELVSIVLAAGKGTRMKSTLPKVLHKVNGQPMICKIVNVLKNAGVEENILILGHKKELVLEILKETETLIDYVVQEEQLGTGHAVMSAEEKLKDHNGLVLITWRYTTINRRNN
jgi:bifunctional UDP-N-acetylglucosamine pyrophosphorylase/glucosamine-1-phosphate N-acetyltransferase